MKNWLIMLVLGVSSSISAQTSIPGWPVTGGGASVTPATVTTALSNVIYATNSTYGLHNNGNFIYDATFVSGQNTISCATTNDCSFTAAVDNGKLCWGTNLAKTGFTAFLTSTTVLPEGTLTVTGAQTATCSGGNATANQTGNGFFAWGTDDTAALAAGWTATLGVCGTFQLPGINSTSNGPSVIVLDSWSSAAGMNTPSYAANTAANCDVKSPPADRAGVGILGQGQNNTIILLTPNFANASPICTAGGGQSCFLSLADGGRISGGITIFGGGISNPKTGLASKILIDLHANNNAYYDDIHLIGYGANASNGIGIGIQFSMLTGYLANIEEDGAGNTGLSALGVGHSGLGCFYCVGYDNAGTNLAVATTGLDTPFNSYNGLYGDAGNTTSCIVRVNGLFNSYGDVLGVGDVTGQDGLCVGIDGANNPQAGTANLFGTRININPTGGSKVGLLVFGGAAKVFAQGVYISTNNAASSVGVSLASATAQYYDMGGNVFVNTPTKFTIGSGQSFGSSSITGTVCATGNWALTSGWGTSSITSVTAGGDSHRCQVVITGAAGSSGPVLTWTFPAAYLVAPGSCQISFNGTLTGESTGAPSTTSVAFTFTGTPSAQTYRLDASCGP